MLSNIEKKVKRRCLTVDKDTLEIKAIGYRRAQAIYTPNCSTKDYEYIGGVYPDGSNDQVEEADLQ